MISSMPSSSAVSPPRDWSAGKRQVYCRVTFLTIPCPVESGLVIFANLQSIPVYNLLPQSPIALVLAFCNPSAAVCIEVGCEYGADSLSV